VNNTLFILTVLCAVVVVSEYLVRKTFLRHAGTALIVIIITAIVANLGLIPTSSTEASPVPLYNIIFSYLAPLSILWLLLDVSLKDIKKAGLPMISIFIIGSLATAIGVLVGTWVVDGKETIGPLSHAIGGMITGTYTGGSINFNAVALHYEVMTDGVLYAGTVVADNIVTTFWMVITIAVPTLLAPIWNSRKNSINPTKSTEPSLGINEDTEHIHPVDFSFVLGIGFISLWASNLLTSYLSDLGFQVPSIIILTIIALILAQFKFISSLPGTRAIGLFAVYIFLAVIGAYCDIGALGSIGQLGVTLLLLMLIAVVIHGIIIFGVAWLLKIDLAMAAVASQANIGGGTTALALARSVGRSDLVLPAVLIGSLGNAIGTFLGFWVASYLL
jgi:uncharacterized membrane protein